jgi:hypothetical protein
MKKTNLLILAVSFILISIVSCSKNNNDNSPSDVADISGTYVVTGMIEHQTLADGTLRDYDEYANQLTPCEKDNELQLNRNLTVNYVDAGTVCSPSFSDAGTWSSTKDNLILSKDFLNSTIKSGKIKSFDGKTLVIDNIPNPGSKDGRTVTYTKK